ncbi:MAG: hypothetical protein AAF108_00765 [Planctomycetota bacterium]
MAVLVSVLPLVGGAGCGFRRVSGEPPRVDPGAARPFAPASMSVHPLTGVVDDALVGERVLALYVDLQDAYGDTVKATGRLTVLLFEAEAGGTPRTIEAALSWRIDLTEPGENSRYFDAATRLYRVSLAGLPASLTSPGRPPLLLRVKYETLDRSSRPQTLRDEHLVR